MFLFSVSSFIDLLNSAVCFLLARRLWVSFRESQNRLVRSFFFFYLTFAVFFLFLGLPFFIPQNPELAQLSFVTAHLFLYFAIAFFNYTFLELAGAVAYSFFISALIAIAGATVFILSFLSGVVV